MPRTQELAKLIAGRRKELGLDQPALAQAIGVSQQTVSRWENGSNVPARHYIDGLATALSLDSDRLHRIAGYYTSPITETGSEAVFDAAIEAIPTFNEQQLLDVLDAAWRSYRSRTVTAGDRPSNP